MKPVPEHEYPTYSRRFLSYRWFKPILVALIFFALYMGATVAMVVAGAIQQGGIENVMDIAGPGDLRIKKGLLAEQSKAGRALLGYYQFMDNYFTPHYLLDIIAARE